MKRFHLIAVALGCSAEAPPPAGSTRPEVTVDSLAAEFAAIRRDDSSGYSEDQWVIHDPSMIVEIDGLLMIGVTGKAQEDGYDCGLETWYLFPGETKFRPGQCLLQNKPGWIATAVPSSDGAYWAPGFADPRTLYYTVPPGGAMEDGRETISCIGLLRASGTAPDLIWTDHGAPITCSALGETNEDAPEPGTIDAATFRDDDGSRYLIYGGGHIWVLRLDSASQTAADGSDRWSMDDPNYTLLANGPDVDADGEPSDEDQWIEAPFLIKHNAYYYLFVNWYTCCAGADSTYEIRVGRADSVLGPFIDAEGRRMTDGGGTLVRSRSDGDIGPGHAGVFSYSSQETGNTKTVFGYHYYPANGRPWATVRHQLMTWNQQGWPVINDAVFDPSDYHSGR